MPVVTIALLIGSEFDSTNIETGGGVAPYGAGSMLTALIGAGLIYSFGGVQYTTFMAAEVRRPRRDLPIGTFVAFGLAALMYLGLQFAFIGAVPNGMLADLGWNGLNFDSPFAQLAGLLSMGWLMQLLLIDAVVSPGGSMLVGVGVNARNTYGLARTRTLPRWVGSVDVRSGVPRRALLLNLGVSIVFLFVFQSWQGLAATLGFLFALGFAIVAVAAGTNSKDPQLTVRPWMRRIGIITPIVFVVYSLLLFWSGWPQVWLSSIIFLIAVPIAVVVMLRDRTVFTPRVFLRGAWFVVYVLFIVAVSALGTFGGAGWLPAPVDMIVVAVGSLLFYWWGCRESIAWMNSPEAPKARGMYC